MDEIAQWLESGNLPDWFPPKEQIDFRGKRRDLLLGGMPLDDLLQIVMEIIELHRGDFADPIYGKHEHRPARINGIEDFTGYACAILARYLYAAALGEEKGLPLLLGHVNADLVIHGKQMRQGRKEGTIGPVRKFIRAVLKKQPHAKNEELWQAIKAKPPKGWTPMRSPQLGRYIEGPTAGDEVKWKSFCSYASLERDRLKNP